MSDLKAQAVEQQLATQYEQLALKFFGKSVTWKLPREPQNDGRQHLEIGSDGKLALVGTDRGQETARLETYDPDELLYWLFRDAAKGAAITEELKNRPADNKRDVRRTWFPIAQKKMEKLSPAWARRLSKEFAEILVHSPFHDR